MHNKLLRFSLCLTMVLATLSAHAATFQQNTLTPNTFGYVNSNTDSFVQYSDINNPADKISSKLYKPSSGSIMVVTFHGNGEGGVKGTCNNYSQIAANRLAVTFSSKAIQEKFNGAYVLAFQAPDNWYDDWSDEAGAIIKRACEEFGIKQVFLAGLSAGGLMCERMLAAYPDMFSGALLSCAAIAKNDTAVAGLGGVYAEPDKTEWINEALKLKKPVDADTYLANYNAWLDKIAASNVPLFLVHSKNDPVISSTWTQYAYDYLTDKRKNNAPVYYRIITSSNHGYRTVGEHFAWERMLNNDIVDSTGKVRTIDFLTGLAKSEGDFAYNAYKIPAPAPSENKGAYKFDVVAEIPDAGERVNKIVIYMNGDKIDASTLKPEAFNVTVWAEDASGLNLEGATCGGELMQAGITKDTPAGVKVYDVCVNNQGNIVLVLEEKATLNYTQPFSRNLAEKLHYSIAPAELSLLH